MMVSVTDSDLQRFLGRLQTMWSGPSLPYPGRSRDAAYATYVHYRREQPLPIPAAGDFDWLRAAGEPPMFEDLPVSTLGSDVLEDHPDVSVLTPASLRERTGQALPDDLLAFAESGLASLVPTVTDCYLDLADYLVDVPGGRLLHLLADSQIILHWHLLLGDDGSQAVLATDKWFGYETDDSTARLDPEGPPQFGIVADTFTEFLWRFWLDNTIWLKVEDALELTADEQNYVAALEPLFPT
jgi:hypothetical protein